jgi:hypothetical protein
MCNVKVIARLISLCTLTLVSAAAHANPHPLPYSYPYSTLPRGMSEFEQYVDMTNAKANLDDTAALSTTLASTLVTEIRIWHLTTAWNWDSIFSSETIPALPPVATSVRSAALRRDEAAPALPVRRRGSLAGQRRHLRRDCELANEIELEAKADPGPAHRALAPDRQTCGPNASSTIRAAANGSPTPPAAWRFEVLPAFHVGVEYWMHGEFGATPPRRRDSTSISTTTSGRRSCCKATGCGWRWRPTCASTTGERAGERGDRFGRFWFRTIIGMEL